MESLVMSQTNGAYIDVHDIECAVRTYEVIVKCINSIKLKLNIFGNIIII